MKLKKPKKKKSLDWKAIEVPAHLRQAKADSKKSPKKQEVSEEEAAHLFGVKKKKGKKVNEKQAAALAKRADELGERYDQQDELSKVAAKALESTKEEIKERAQIVGTVNGKDVTFTGKRYKVGFTYTDPTPKPDASLIRKHLPKSMHKTLIAKVVQTAEIVDEVLLEKFLTEGLLTADQVKKVCVTAAPQRRILVQRL